MKSFLRTALTVIAAAILLPVSALTAVALVDNDTPSGAIATTLGSTYTQDTRDSETEPLDAELNGNCGAPAVEGSVWYSYTATADDRGILLDGSASNYSLGFMIFSGDPANGGELVACGPMMSATTTTAGNTYYIMAFTDTTGIPAGGDLEFTINGAPDAPTVSVTMDARGTAYRDGSVRVTGTYSCTDADYSEIYGELTQKVGRVKISGSFWLADLTCDGETHTWEAHVTSSNGYFAGGKAASLTLGFVCGSFDCSDGYLERTIQLSRAKR
ncbi:MAG: hypothetical protein IPL43_07935 [Micropruina sp.]|nr:hypothetical protein [Micropruina sp.]